MFPVSVAFFQKQLIYNCTATENGVFRVQNSLMALLYIKYTNPTVTKNVMQGKLIAVAYTLRTY